MTFKTLALAAVLAAAPIAASAHVVIENAVARVTSPLAQTASVYLTIRNHSAEPDRLFQVTGDVADRVELHTHTQDDAGVMRMTELEDGTTIASGETHAFTPGADHIMLLGLSEPLEQGDTFELLLFFDVWVPVTVTVTVDNEAVNALAGHGHGGTHGDMDMEDDEMEMDGDGHGSHGSSDG
jgi:copper(I)-binding protein